MSMLPIILIGAGYVALVVTAGPLGLGLAAVHISIMLAAVALGKKSAPAARPEAER